METGPEILQETRPASPEAVVCEYTVGQHENPRGNHLSLVTGFGRIEMTSDIGGPQSKYKVNEDSGFAIADSNSFSFGIIDGAGGSDNGLLASITANRAFRDALSHGRTLEDAFHEADMTVRRLEGRCYAAAAVASIKAESHEDYEVSFVGIGDAKIMTVRGGEILPEGTTQFQNEAWEAVAGTADEHQYYLHPNISKITGALGAEEALNTLPPQFLSFNGKKGDVFVAASDGVWDDVSAFEVQEIVKKIGPEAAKIEKAIFDLAMQRSNSGEQFIIRHDEQRSVHKLVRKGDNISVSVMVLE